ncbi:MAG: sodium/solute symporter [Verrucomicrobiota bacterium]
MSKISIIDWIIIVLYLGGIVGAGVYVGLKKRKGGAAGSYFLAGNTLGWGSIGLALFATNISCLHLVSLAQAGYDSGLMMGNFEWLAAFALVALSLFFVPFYMRAKISTLPDFLEKRYCPECRNWLAGLSMVTAIIFNIAFPLSTGWLVLHGVFGIDKWVCIITLTSLTAVYTILGGLSAVVLTETIQAIILLAGSLIITALAYSKVGGWGGMFSQLEASHDLVKMSMLRTAAQEPSMPWYAVALGYPALCIWYWCADQTIVQRVLGAKDENHARTGPLFCGLIKVFPVFVFILPGLMFLTMIQGGKLDGIAQLRVRNENAMTQTAQGPRRAYEMEMSGAEMEGKIEHLVYTEGDSPLDLTKTLANGGKAMTLMTGMDAKNLVLPANVTLMSSKETYGLMIRNLMPVGLFGVMAAALMAALMGNLASASNSIATLFSYDLYRRFRPETPENKLVFIGRMASLGAFLLGIALVPLLDNYKSIFAGINDIIAHIAPPISCVFAVGVFWPRASAFSAKWTMWIGSLMGTLIFMLKTLYVWKPAEFGWIPSFFYKTPFMLMAFYMLAFCIVLQVALTLIHPKQAAEDPEHLYWEHPLDPLKSPGWPGLANYKVLAALVVVAMCGLYYFFR